MSLNKTLAFILIPKILDNHWVEMKIDNDVNSLKKKNEITKVIVSYLHIY